MGHDEYTKSEIRRYHRAMLRELEYAMPAGVTRSVPRLGETCGHMEGDHSIADRVVKMRVWMRDSIAWALESAARGRMIEAFRGYVQATLYAGTLDGAGVYPHNVTTSDAIAFLRHMCERTLERSLVESGRSL